MTVERCHNEQGACLLKPKCEHACSLRVQPVVDALAARDDAVRLMLASIGQQIGYGNAQSILGKLWDEMLTAEYGVSGRGRMGVSANERGAFDRGWEACMRTWADHMKRMAKAVENKRSAARATGATK
jgi:hypothetical protein